MPRLRVNTPLWLGRDSAARHRPFPDADPRARGGRRHRRRRHHRRRARVALRGRRRPRRPRRSRKNRPRQHGREHCAAHAGTRHGSGGAVPQVRHGPGASGVAAQPRSDTRLCRHADATAVSNVTSSAATPSITQRSSGTSAGCATSIADAWRRASTRAGWRAPALRRALGFDAPAGIRTGGNAQADPFKACLGLMRAAERAGARVFERSPVAAIRPSSRDVRRHDTARRHPRRSRA